MRFVISGRAGTGKSSLARMIASTIGLPMLSIGSNLFRAVAEERGVALAAIDGEALRNRAIDEAVDQHVYAFAHAHHACVIEGWAAWHSVGNTSGTFKVKLACDEVTRFARAASRQEIPFSQAREETLAREAGVAARFAHIPDWDDDRHHDLVIDTTELPLGEVFERVANAYRLHAGLS